MKKNKVFAKHNSINKSYKLYQKLGFEVEGIYKKHGKYQGKYCDIIRMALFNPNYNTND